MKMPFGKHKGTELNKLPFEYVYWLNSITLKDPLKSELKTITASEEYQLFILNRYDRMEARNEEIDYSEDINFWSKVSPAATYDYLNRTGKKKDIPLDDWKYLCYELQRRGY